MPTTFRQFSSPYNIRQIFRKTTTTILNNILIYFVRSKAESIGEQAIILNKGSRDTICDGRKSTPTISCGIAGSGRRCGGQGDLLAGALSVFTCWAQGREAEPSAPGTPAMIACYAACRMVRECNAAAFKVKHRGMLATDMVNEVSPVFQRFYETS